MNYESGEKGTLILLIRSVKMNDANGLGEE